MYLSYDEENEFDSMIAEHLKGTLLSMNISVFDPYKDVQCGHLFLTEEANAVMNSQRFLVIASESYIAHKGIQFDFIQAAIVGQRSRLKDRLLIIKSEECDIDRLYQVPCIAVPEYLKDRGALDETVVNSFFKWEKDTKPQDTKCEPHAMNSIMEVLFSGKILIALCIVMMFILIIVIRFFYIVI
ncbi:hypothetical protein BgiBS90_004884 [Biomphalaria glabrata]|nr:hypothetical protein BgiBS90_004884 [Biomphalaria glabrata]